MKLNIVPARTGITWVKLGIQVFLRQPLALTGLFFLYMMAATLVSLVPYLGVAIALALVPAATLGLMVATQVASEGRFPMPAVLLSAFRADRQRGRSMLVLGFLYAAACLLIVSVVPLFFDVPVTRESALTPEMQGVMVVVLLLYLPVSVLFWHAPALVHWHGIPPVKSLFFSAVVCLRNAGAYTLFGLTWVVVLVLIGMVVTLTVGLLASPETTAAVIMPVALLLAAMFSSSMYFTFRDSFETPPTDDSPSPGDTP